MGKDLLASDEWTRIWKSLLEMKRRVGLGGARHRCCSFLLEQI